MTVDPNLKILPDVDAVARAAADVLVIASTTAIGDRGSFSVALSGGSTPRKLYELLASGDYRDQLQIDRWHIYFGDERCVPPDHDDSNFRMASESMLSKLPLDASQIHRMQGELEPMAAADAYAKLLAERFGVEGPAIDVTLLGMGDDGHTASLFPESAALSATTPCVAHFVPKLDAHRITLSSTFINRSRSVLVMVCGASKARRVHEVLRGEVEPMRLPIQSIAPAGDYTWLLDATAGGMI